jgi:RNA polymerase primary sigma factor
VETPEWSDDPVQVYLREACNAPELTKDEQVELSQHVLANDVDAESAGVRLLQANLRMVVAIAEEYRGAGVDVLTLIQKGNEGLLLALKTLADNPDQQFSAYATACVHHAIAKTVEDSRA